MRRLFIKMCLILGCAFILSSCGDKEEEAEFQEIEEIEAEDNETEVMDETEPEEAWIYVHVCGEVKNPGVYQLAVNSRLFEAVEAAGGMTKDAQEASMNLAQALVDGEQIYIPSQEEEEKRPESAEETDDGKVNINTASREELMTLSGIGEAKADAIIQYREEHGGFQSLEELTEVEGIKEGVFQKVKDIIKIE